MKYYQEISIPPSADIGLYFILQKVFQQIHLALVQNQNEDNTSSIGLSFPGYDAEKFTLGSKIHLLSQNIDILENIQVHQGLRRLRDYLSVDQITTVPQNIETYACFRQVKLKGSKEKLARRRAKRKGESFHEALLHYDNYNEEKSFLPYINMTSQTNGHKFRLYIEKSVQSEPCLGNFSCYGLSKEATVPVF